MKDHQTHRSFTLAAVGLCSSLPLAFGAGKRARGGIAGPGVRTPVEGVLPVETLVVAGVFVGCTVAPAVGTHV